MEIEKIDIELLCFYDAENGSVSTGSYWMLSYPNECGNPT